MQTQPQHQLTGHAARYMLACHLSMLPECGGVLHGFSSSPPILLCKQEPGEAHLVVQLLQLQQLELLAEDERPSELEIPAGQPCDH